MSQQAFYAKTIKEALDKAKRELGDDAFVVNSEKTEKGIKIVATNSEDNSSDLNHIKKDNAYPVTRKTLEKAKEKLTALEKPIDAIKYIVDTCERQHLGFDFCEKWLEAVSPDLKKEAFFLDDSLSRIISFNENWINERTYEEPIILVGPQGAGKTATLGKLALILKSAKKNVRVVTLDEKKAGAIEQLSAYLNPLQVSLGKGYDAYLKEKENAMRDNAVLLVDTPGINILSKEGQVFFFKMSERFQTPLSLVLPSDLNENIALEMAKEFIVYNTRYLVGTRFDLASYYGGFFSIAFQNKLTPLFYSDSARISDPVKILCARRALNLFAEEKK